MRRQKIMGYIPAGELKSTNEAMLGELSGDGTKTEPTTGSVNNKHSPPDS
jgi:hypothetical protein